ncbi:lantibiotic immunity ABC transporter MutE/EpiE family permease subunit [Blautia marasmi]|uniref:lantibiotic immunity ABC transporter MutE/EpiE family permease subunit n=1 Tax=Blautia marasmi TaxID=1917868 RepID=UPI00266B8CB2|nr:lantibiotic immunity ABC transporter MutE/EpiE family permease subunit [Blautia marasmi]
MHGLQSEFLKYKRTFMKKLILFIPVFFAVYALVTQVSLMDNPQSENSSWGWQSLLALIFNWWPFVFLPLGFALFAALAAAQEKRSGNYRSLRTRDISAKALWINKIAAIAIYSLLSTLVLMAAAVAAGLTTKAGTIPFGEILAAGIVCWLSSLALIPIQLWAAEWKGLFLSMGIGFAGMIAGILAAPSSFWFAVPWSLATRLMCPIIGVHPNGVLLEAGDPLLDPSVIPVGVVVSIAAFLVFTVLSSVWFAGKEEQ